MNDLHSDALLGGMWSWESETDEAIVHDSLDEIHDLLRQMLDTFDD